MSLRPAIALFRVSTSPQKAGLSDPEHAVRRTAPVARVAATAENLVKVFMYEIFIRASGDSG
jgi:hypothetical protein